MAAADISLAPWLKGSLGNPPRTYAGLPKGHTTFGAVDLPPDADASRALVVARSPDTCHSLRPKVSVPLPTPGSPTEGAGAHLVRIRHRVSSEISEGVGHPAKSSVTLPPVRLPTKRPAGSLLQNLREILQAAEIIVLLDPAFDAELRQNGGLAHTFCGFGTESRTRYQKVCAGQQSLMLYYVTDGTNPGRRMG